MAYSSGKYKRYKRARSKSRKYKSKYRTYKSKYRSYKARAKSQPKSSWGWRGNQASVSRALHIGAERKWYDTGFHEVRVYDAADGFHVIQLNSNIAANASVNGRIGNKINIISVQLEAAFIPVVGCAAARFRAFIVHDSQCNGVAPPLDSILTSSSNAAYAFMNLAYRDRFRVICEDTFTLGLIQSDGGTPARYYTVSPCTANISRYVKTDIPVVYLDASAGVPGTGALYLVVCSADATSASTGYDFQYNVRLRFVDV